MTAGAEKRILIVQGGDASRDHLSSRLRRQSLRVDEAATIDEALLRLEKGNYSVAVIDAYLEDGDAVNLLSRVTSVREWPVILILAPAGESVEGKFDPRRVHGIVRKPIDPDEVAELVRVCAEIRGSSLGAMCMATMIVSTPFLALLSSKL